MNGESRSCELLHRADKACRNCCGTVAYRSWLQQLCVRGVYLLRRHRPVFREETRETAFVADMKPAILLARGVVITALALGLSDLLAAPPGVPVQPEVVDIRTGEVLYAQHCASCHGARLEGQQDWRKQAAEGVYPAPPHDETGHTWHHGDGLLFAYTKYGGEATFAARGLKGIKSGMPGFGHALSDQEIWNILAFIKSTWSERMRKVQAKRTEAEQLDSP